MNRKLASAVAAALAAVMLAACGSSGTTSSRTPAEPANTSTACPGINCTQPAPAPSTPANAVPMLRQTGAKLSPGLGSYAVSADGTFPGGESLSVYTYGTAPDYQDELGRLATVYPTNFGTYITLPGKLAVIVINGGGVDANGNQTWGGPTPQQLAARTGGTVA